MTNQPTGAHTPGDRHTAPGSASQHAAGAPPGTTTGAPTEDLSNASMGELFGNISEDFSTLVRQEIALAKAELNQTVSKVGKGAGMFGGAGLAGHFTLLFLSLALWWAIGAMIGQGDAQPALGWSALIVAAIWAIVATILALTGRKEIKDAKGIPQTTDTVKQIPDAVKGQDH